MAKGKAGEMVCMSWLFSDVLMIYEMKCGAKKRMGGDGQYLHQVGTSIVL